MHNDQRPLVRRGISLLMAGTLALAPALAPVSAFATSSAQLQQELAAATAELDSLQATLDQAEAELGKTNYELDMTREEMAALEQQIEETEAELVVAREHLSTVIESTYKQGTPNLVDLFLGAESFDDLVSRIYYANKVSAAQKDAIDTVTTLQASLESDQESLRVHEVELTELLEAQQAQQAEAEAAAAAQAAYIGQLSSELQAAIAAERAAAAEASRAAAERARQEEAANRSQEQSNSSNESTNSDNGSNSGSNPGPTPDPEPTYVEPDPEPYYDPTPVNTTPTPSYDSSGSLHDIALSAALSQVGKPYGHDNNGANFDCNGLTNWAWAQAGVSIPYASGHYSYGQFQWMKNSGRYVYSLGQLSPGDLVFFSYDGGATCYHVAMYVGGGMVVHALSYSQGIQVTPLDWCDGFCGGGSPV